MFRLLTRPESPNNFPATSYRVMCEQQLVFADQPALRWESFCTVSIIVTIKWVLHYIYFYSIGWSSKYTIQHLNLCIRYSTYSKLAFADQRAEGRERSDAISDARAGRSNRSTDRRKEIAGEQSRRSKTTTTTATTTTTTNVSCSSGSSGSRDRSGKIVFF